MSSASADRDFLLALGRRIREVRIQKGLTQAQAAFDAGIDHKYWQRLEGNKPPAISVVTLKKVATGLQSTMEQLVRDL